MADSCVQLAQRLAGNEKKIRDRALRRLRAYLRERSREGGFTSEEFCKIWKGLFYCMWMQDKPLLQEELARNMAQLVHMLHTRESRNLFLRAFWQTLNREWNGIDRLRLDKFYTLIRFVLHQSGQLVRQADWEESMVDEFLSILVEEVLKAEEASRGVQHHLIDIYLEELGKIGSAELTAELNLKLIEPFCKIAAKTKDLMLQQSVVNGIFQIILDQAPFAIEDLMKELGHNPTNEESADGGSRSGGHLAQDVEDIGPVLQFDYQAVSDRLFTLASRQNIPMRNRKRLYGLVKRFKDLAEGIFPQDDFPEEVSTDEDDDEFSSWRFRKRQKKFQEQLMLETQGFIPEPEKKKRRQMVSSSGESPEEPGKADGPPAKKKRKKKAPHPGRETDHSKLNGEAELPPARKMEETKSKKCPAQEEPETAQPHCTGTALTADSSSAKARVKRRRSRLLRLSLSVLPLRGAMMMRRRRALGRSRQVTYHRPETAPVAPPVAPVAPSVAPATPQVKVVSTSQDFVTFRKSETPKPLYVKSSKSGGRQIHEDQNCNSKKVTFSLNKNMTAEFKRTDRSLLVSPAGSSRVPFNPDQRPQHGVLKTPSPVPRPRASDFF